MYVHKERQDAGSEEGRRIICQEHFYWMAVLSSEGDGRNKAMVLSVYILVENGHVEKTMDPVLASFVHNNHKCDLREEDWQIGQPAGYLDVKHHEEGRIREDEYHEGRQEEMIEQFA